MGDRRPLASFTSGDFDYPPATSSHNDTPQAVTTRLESLRNELQRTREQTRATSHAAAVARRARAAHSSWPRRRRLRETEYHTPPPDMYPVMDDSPDMDEGRRRGAKRRKRHHDEPVATYAYGHYGQVEAGRLRLVLESCDGDVHDDRGRTYYGPENLLQHNKSVYCTRTSRCNIVLRHHDSSPFTLEKLYIIAPENGFTAPLKEGLVYVAMSQEDLIPHLQGINQPEPCLAPPRSPSRQDRSNAPLSLLESLNDPEVSRALSQHRSREWSPFDSTADRNTASPENDDDDEDTLWGEMAGDSAPRPPQQTSSTTTPPVNHPSDVTECDELTGPAPGESARIVLLTDDEINCPEDPTTAAVLADRERRERNMAIVDDDNMYGWDSRFRAAHARIRGRGQPQQRKAREEPVPSPQVDQAMKDGVTCARFLIKDGKHKVAVKFDPPVSGTHVLLKLQTPYTGKNIDIQTVIASGFAGPRFFPAVQLK